MFSDGTCLLRTPDEPPPLPGAGRFDPAPPVAAGLAPGPEPVRVHLVLVWNARLLFARRSESGVWGFPSDTLCAGESAVDGACRIGAEQVMVELARSSVCLVHVHQSVGASSAEAGLFLRAGRFRGIPLAVDPRQTDQLAWSPPTTVPEPCAPGVAYAAAVSGGACAADAAGYVPGGPTPGGVDDHGIPHP